MFVSRTAAAVLGAGLLCVTAHASAADPPQSELDQVKADIISGKIPINSPSVPK